LHVHDATVSAVLPAAQGVVARANGLQARQARHCRPLPKKPALQAQVAPLTVPPGQRGLVMEAAGDTQTQGAQALPLP
jgi:hypothetical protein